MPRKCQKRPGQGPRQCSVKVTCGTGWENSLTCCLVLICTQLQRGPQRCDPAQRSPSGYPRKSRISSDVSRLAHAGRSRSWLARLSPATSNASSKSSKASNAALRMYGQVASCPMNKRWPSWMPQSRQHQSEKPCVAGDTRGHLVARRAGRADRDRLLHRGRQSSCGPKRRAKSPAGRQSAGPSRDRPPGARAWNLREGGSRTALHHCL